MINMMYLVLTALLAWWCLGERPSPRIGLALLLGWLGVFVLMEIGRAHV